MKDANSIDSAVALEAGPRKPTSESEPRIPTFSSSQNEQTPGADTTEKVPSWLTRFTRKTVELMEEIWNIGLRPNQ
jgi:hypothetical protein